VQRYRAGESAEDLAKTLDVAASSIYVWNKLFEDSSTVARKEVKAAVRKDNATAANGIKTALTRC